MHDSPELLRRPFLSRGFSSATGGVCSLSLSIEGDEELLESSSQVLGRTVGSGVVSTVLDEAAAIKRLAAATAADEYADISSILSSGGGENTGLFFVKLIDGVSMGERVGFGGVSVSTVGGVGGVVSGAGPSEVISGLILSGIVGDVSIASGIGNSLSIGCQLAFSSFFTKITWSASELGLELLVLSG